MTLYSEKPGIHPSIVNRFWSNNRDTVLLYSIDVELIRDRHGLPPADHPDSAELFAAGVIEGVGKFFMSGFESPVAWGDALGYTLLLMRNQEMHLPGGLGADDMSHSPGIGLVRESYQVASALKRHIRGDIHGSGFGCVHNLFYYLMSCGHSYRIMVSFATERALGELEQRLSADREE